MEKMIDYRLPPEAMVMVAGSSIGTQRKFYEAGFWYKQNNIGYEGLSEYLAAVVLSCSNIDRYVAYERCQINKREGCRCANFLLKDETYISLQRLYDMYHGGQLSEQIRMIESVKERIQFVVRFVSSTTGLEIAEQLGKLLTFDMVILNTDRHFNNIGIIADILHNEYRLAPVFDNGNSLLSNVGEFPFDEPFEEQIERAVGQPFCANLERQAMELGYGFKVNYGELYRKLEGEPESRALNVLKFQLERYEALIRN